MAETMRMQDIPRYNEVSKLRKIRKKYRQVFGCDITMRDEALLQRYTITGNGDLIMILK